MARSPKRLPAFFYQSARGAEPVREWLKSLSDDDRRVIGEDIATVEFGWPVGMPICRPMGDGVWEVRSTLRNRREARVLFCIVAESMVLLHGFIKKTQKTSRSDLDLALNRKKEVER